MTSMIPFTHLRDLVQTIACVDCEKRVELTAAEAEFGGWERSGETASRPARGLDDLPDLRGRSEDLEDEEGRMSDQIFEWSNGISGVEIVEQSGMVRVHAPFAALLPRDRVVELRDALTKWLADDAQAMRDFGATCNRCGEQINSLPRGSCGANAADIP